MTAAEPLVECLGLVKIYATASGRVQALRGVDLTIARRSAIAVVGPSGSGKSSLLRIIAGLDLPTAGTVTVDGVDLTRANRRRRGALRTRLLSHVYQRPADNLISHLTALQQVERVAVRRKHPPAAAVEVLHRVGLDDRLHHRPHELSGGEQQRLAFARAAVGSPALVIADEPTAELDSINSTLVLDTIEQLVNTGVTVIIATHDPHVLDRLTHVVTLRDGAIASISEYGETFAVMDHTGRLQLPPDHRRRFEDGRAHLAWDDQVNQLTARPNQPR